MRLLSLIVACLLLVIGLAGLAVRFVPPEHLGTRGETRLEPGPHWTTPLHPIRVQVDGPQVYGLRGAHDAFAATDTQGRPVQIGAILDGATIEQVKAGLAAGSASIKGATIFMRAGDKRAEAAALQARRDALEDEARAVSQRTILAQVKQNVDAGAAQDARNRGAAKEEQARQRAQAANTAAIERVRAEARAEIAAVRTRDGAEAAGLVAAGTLALARAEAQRDRLRGQALAGPGGRYHLAIDAARRFGVDAHRFDPGRLDPSHPEYFRATWGLTAWRAYFMGEAEPPTPALPLP